MVLFCQSYRVLMFFLSKSDACCAFEFHLNPPFFVGSINCFAILPFSVFFVITGLTQKAYLPFTFFGVGHCSTLLILLGSIATLCLEMMCPKYFLNIWAKWHFLLAMVTGSRCTIPLSLSLVCCFSLRVVFQLSSSCHCFLDLHSYTQSN